ncbi:phosphatidylserine decarboxylase [Amaricoccus sp.]|uniref:phosphatidylserine decarboxylase n=1 Tax=Amaricoccus sp. TaxID=1872485 RepID=UPI001B3EFC6E|nr:phosphatidylserine decarboxylase [Amaricoccus sp.]MBP7241765.1 phosphatidylserine decarboxylase [Amaricoccus sp.]
MSISLLSTFIKPVHREGWRFIALFAALAAALFLLHPAVGWVGVLLTLWCYYFFRDPERVTPARDGLVVSPADGIVSMIAAAAPPPELDLGPASLTRVSIFMNVFNCHVNRSPADGTVTRVAYRPGRFFNASLDKASADNERNALAIALPDGRRLAVVQIAGLVARRIVCDAAEGQALRAGERFGMIRFGSRLDVYLPEGVAPLVAPGQSAIAGETVIADLASPEPARRGEIR